MHAGAAARLFRRALQIDLHATDQHENRGDSLCTVPRSIPVAPPDTNGLVAAKAIPHAQLKVLPGVGHYDFLSTCTTAGVAAVPLCAAIKVPQDSTHEAAIDMALAFFARTLGAP